MKRIMLAISAVALAAGLFVSCEKTPQDNGKPADEKITVSMKADATFAADNIGGSLFARAASRKFRKCRVCREHIGPKGI